MEATTAARWTGAISSSVRGVLAASMRGALAGFLAVAALFAGVGVLYLVRGATPLALGPGVPGALPLQQLAGGESQPLLRMAIAWVPAGLVAGLALASLTRLGPVARTVSLAAFAALVLLLAGAAADAIAITDPLRPHLLPQLTRIGTWTAVVLFGIGSALAGRLVRSRG